MVEQLFERKLCEIGAVKYQVYGNYEGDDNFKFDKLSGLTEQWSNYFDI